MNLPPPELYISSNSLRPGYQYKPEESNLNTNSGRMIPLRILPSTAPQVITTTKTLRRFCGFVLALLGFIFYCLRVIVLIAWLGINYYYDTINDDWLIAGLEAIACVLGIGMFFRIIKYPYLTLESHNFKVRYHLKIEIRQFIVILECILVLFNPFGFIP